jgi:glucose/arabinose dehydrogenase
MIAAVTLAVLFGACADSSGTTTASIVVVTSTTSPTISVVTPATTEGAPPPSSTTTVTTEPEVLIPLADIDLDVELVADGFRQPILAIARAGDDRLFIVDQPGVVYALDLASASTTVVLDIADAVRFSGEQGLLGIAFDPADADRMIAHYSARDGSTTIVEYRLDDAGVADPGSRREILTVDQPATNHNGGMIAFGPEGLLFIGLGDGGGANDQFDNGQDPTTLLGTILRLDLDAGDPYGIPADNPFADGVGGAPEVWAWGLRNPWRFSFDGSDLWVADVGQAAWEEIDLLDATRPGTNAGWPLLEGSHCFRFEPCDRDPFTGPIFEYFHDGGRCSVTGGVVYRGSAIPELVGTYLFGDYCSGEGWGLRTEPVEIRVFTDPDDVFLPSLGPLTSFGVGPAGEVYVMQSIGLVWRLVGA